MLYYLHQSHLVANVPNQAKLLYPRKKARSPVNPSIVFQANRGLEEKEQREEEEGKGKNSTWPEKPGTNTLKPLAIRLRNRSDSTQRVSDYRHSLQ